MSAEEMMGRFVVDLARYLEECEELLSPDDREGVRVEIDDLWGRGED